MLALLLAGLASAGSANAAPLEWLPVQSDLYDELDLLRGEGLLDTTSSLDTRPMSRADVARLVAFALVHHPDRGDHPGLIRLAREFSRELVDLGFSPTPRSTRPLLLWSPGHEAPLAGPEHPDERLRVIPYVETALERRPDGRARLANGSRGGLRIGVELGNVLLYQDLFAGRVTGGRTFADPLIQDTDFIHYTEDTYLSARVRWLDLSFGRTRHAWGPGREGTLLWSETAAPVTYLSWGASLFGGRARGTAVHADVDAARGARLAAHRVDLALTPKWSLGLAEAARYDSPTWEPLYVVSIIPYTLVQRMLAQDALGDTSVNVRNNVVISADARWRMLPGSTLYGEFLVDDLMFKKKGTPVRVGYQVGWLGSGRFLGRRLWWRGEYARVHRFVYAVFYHEDFIHQQQPIGFPEGPDSRSIVVRGALDLSADWSLTAGARRVDHGEGRLGEFFDPDGPSQKGSEFAGVVEQARSLEAGAAWTPRDGVAARILWGYRWVENADHVEGQDRESWFGNLSLLLHY